MLQGIPVVSASKCGYSWQLCVASSYCTWPYIIYIPRCTCHVRNAVFTAAHTSSREGYRYLPTTLPCLFNIYNFYLTSTVHMHQIDFVSMWMYLYASCPRCMYCHGHATTVLMITFPKTLLGDRCILRCIHYLIISM